MGFSPESYTIMTMCRQQKKLGKIPSFFWLRAYSLKLKAYLTTSISLSTAMFTVVLSQIEPPIKPLARTVSSSF